MTKSCSICAHPNRDKIEKLFVQGDSLRDIEKIFNVSKSALWRHKNEHINIFSPAISGDPEAIASNDNLLSQLQDIHQRTLAILDSAEKSGNNDQALRAIAQAGKNLELLAKISLVLADRLKAVNETPDGSKIIFANLIYPDRTTTLDMRALQLREFIIGLRKQNRITDMLKMSDEDLKNVVETCYMPIEK